ncbi:MAG: polysaccharide biosynthesis/export family protein [Vicinamibacterales bacterium]
MRECLRSRRLRAAGLMAGGVAMWLFASVAGLAQSPPVQAGAATSQAGAPPQTVAAPPQTAATPRAPAATDASQAPDTAPDYQIGPGDMLKFSVSGLGMFNVSARVSNTGKVHIPYAGVLKVAGQTPHQVEALVADTLKTGGLVKDPWVTVTIEQYRAQPVYILGEVSDPGQYVIKDEMYLVDLITLSGGFNEVATPTGYLYRRRTDANGLPEGEAAPDEAIEIDFKALNEGTRPDLNLKLRGGDVLYVPQRRRDFFFVVGDVLKPGAFEIRWDAQAVLASQAIGRAGGPMRTAKLSKGVLVRSDAEGHREEVPVDFKAILEGRQADITMRANDVLFIPGSTAKTLAYGLLGTIPGMVERNTIIR